MTRVRWGHDRCSRQTPRRRWAPPLPCPRSAELRAASAAFGRALCATPSTAGQRDDISRRPPAYALTLVDPPRSTAVVCRRRWSICSERGRCWRRCWSICPGRPKTVAALPPVRRRGVSADRPPSVARRRQWPMHADAESTRGFRGLRREVGAVGGLAAGRIVASPVATARSPGAGFGHGHDREESPSPGPRKVSISRASRCRRPYVGFAGALLRSMARPAYSSIEARAQMPRPPP